MILDALVIQLAHRFRHEKRARVCLWFDERREFVRLLPALREHLAAMAQPPFRLLEYDEEQRHGQVWLKCQIWRTLVAADPAEYKHLRFVTYLPLSEDRPERAARMEMRRSICSSNTVSPASSGASMESARRSSAFSGKPGSRCLSNPPSSVGCTKAVRTRRSPSTLRSLSIDPRISGTPHLRPQWLSRVLSATLTRQSSTWLSIPTVHGRGLKTKGYMVSSWRWSGSATAARRRTRLPTNGCANLSRRSR